MIERILKLVVLLFTLPCLAAPVLTFRADGVDITNLAPGGRVALFAVQQEPDSDHLKVRMFAESLSDDDGDGRITYAASVRPQSIWVAAEIDGGELTSASPADFVLEPIPGSALRSPQSISLRSDSMEVFYFRPEVGAWRMTVIDSGAKDSDREPDGNVTISFDRADAIGNAPASPDRYQQGDVLVAIDPLELKGYILGAGK